MFLFVFLLLACPETRYGFISWLPGWLGGKDVLNGLDELFLGITYCFTATTSNFLHIDQVWIYIGCEEDYRHLLLR